MPCPLIFWAQRAILVTVTHPRGRSPLAPAEAQQRRPPPIPHQVIAPDRPHAYSLGGDGPGHTGRRPRHRRLLGVVDHLRRADRRRRLVFYETAEARGQDLARTAPLARTTKPPRSRRTGPDRPSLAGFTLNTAAVLPI